MKLAFLALTAMMGLLQLSNGANLRAEILSRLESSETLGSEFDVDNTMTETALDLDQGMVWEDIDPVLLFNKPSSGLIVDVDGKPNPSCGNEAGMFVQADTDLFILLCGSFCNIKDTIKAPRLAGGIKCLGNTKIDITLIGMNHPIFEAVGQRCLPYIDLEPTTSPRNEAAIASCELANEFIAAPVAWIADNIDEKVWNGEILVALLADASEEVPNVAKDREAPLKEFGNNFKNLAQNVGKKIGNFAKNAGKKIGNFFKNFRHLPRVLG